MAHVIKPMGKIVSIVETSGSVDLGQLMSRSATFAWGSMFARTQLQTTDLAVQGRLLSAVSQWIDQWKIRSIAGARLLGISAQNFAPLTKGPNPASSSSMAGLSNFSKITFLQTNPTS